mmetsp:Transcript_59204/g.141369  ORF Transcript_59204/g.141369 Transcript_59204/m.141369 type:complete len:93 (-) Transcript_59204:268-546(-)
MVNYHMAQVVGHLRVVLVDAVQQEVAAACDGGAHMESDFELSPEDMRLAHRRTRLEAEAYAQAHGVEVLDDRAAALCDRVGVHYPQDVAASS